MTTPPLGVNLVFSDGTGELTIGPFLHGVIITDTAISVPFGHPVLMGTKTVATRDDPDGQWQLSAPSHGLFDREVKVVTAAMPDTQGASELVSELHTEAGSSDLAASIRDLLLRAAGRITVLTIGLGILTEELDMARRAPDPA